MNNDLGIYAKSKNKEGAWEFLKTFLTKDYICGSQGNYYYGFPLRKDALEEIIKRNSTTEEYVDDYGNTITPLDSSWGYDDLDVEIGPLSDEQVQMVRDVIANVDHLYQYNDDVMSIISDEAGAFFSGQKTSKEVADIIQNRVSTYVNENR
jgi:ABC-type glycerol-3-phosphate transport system substrate-binding protein